MTRRVTVEQARRVTTSSLTTMPLLRVWATDNPEDLDVFALSAQDLAADWLDMHAEIEKLTKERDDLKARVGPLQAFAIDEWKP